MPVAYTTQASILGEIAQPWLIQGLDDVGSGTLNAVTLAQIILDCSNRVDSYLSGIYSVPFAATPNSPSKAAEYALMFSCEEIYRRRIMTTGETNPYKHICDGIRTILGKIAARAPDAPSFDAGIASGFAPMVVQTIPMALDMSLA